MTLLQFAAEQLAPLFTDLAGAKKAMSQVDKAMKHEPAPPAPAQPGALVAEAVPIAQIRQLVAEPPMTWTKNAWTCGDATTVTITYADGTRDERACAAGAVIRVAGGLLQFPLPPE